jgi:hypothetical protein
MVNGGNSRDEALPPAHMSVLLTLIQGYRPSKLVIRSHWDRFFIASGGASGSRMDREVQEQPLSVSG